MSQEFFHKFEADFLSTKKPVKGFTLIELLIVVAIIAILAALTLSTLGYVNKKGARSRAEAEIAALSAAIESYKIEFGAYPANQTNLYTELVGLGPDNTNKVLFEPKPQMLVTNSGTIFFADPWGTAYRYQTNSSPDAPMVNISFFDLWTQAGESTSNSNNWIRN